MRYIFSVMIVFAVFVSLICFIGETSNVTEIASEDCTRCHDIKTDTGKKKEGYISEKT